MSLATALGKTKAQEVPTHNWDKYDFGSGPPVTERLNQGPFGIEQDEGWYTVLVTSQSSKPVRNYGLGLVGYTWEEGGPSLTARAGKESCRRPLDNAPRGRSRHSERRTESGSPTARPDSRPHR